MRHRLELSQKKKKGERNLWKRFPRECVRVSVVFAVVVVAAAYGLWVVFVG